MTLGRRVPPQASGQVPPPREFYLPPIRPVVIPGSDLQLPPVRPLVLPNVEMRQPPPNPYQAPAPLIYPYATTAELDQIIDISSSNASSYAMVPPFIDISSSSDSSYNTMNQHLGERSGGTSREVDPWAGAAPARVEAYDQGNAYDGHRAHFGSPSVPARSGDSSAHGEQFRSFEDRAHEPCNNRYQDDTHALLHLSNNRRRKSTSKSVRPHPYREQHRIALDQESGPPRHRGGRENLSGAFENLQDNPDWDGSNNDNSRPRSAPLSHGAAMSNSRSSYESSERTVTNHELPSEGQEYTSRSSERAVTRNTLSSRPQDIGRTSNSRSTNKSVGGRQTSRLSDDFASEQCHRGSFYEADDEATSASEQRPRRGSFHEADDEATSSMGWSMPRPTQVAPASPGEANGPNLRGPGMSNSKGSQESPSDWNISPYEESDNHASATSRDATNDATCSTCQAHSNYMLDTENSVNDNHNNHSAELARIGRE